MRQSRIMLLMGATALVAAAGGFEASHSPAGRPSPVAPASATETAQPSSDSVDVAPPALHNMDLHLATADVQPLVQTVRTTGVVAFNDLRMAQLSPPARGRIQSIEVAVGQPVRAGQRLALLDNYDLGDTRSHIAAAQASLVQARAEASAAQAAYNRSGELVRIGGMAQSELERRRAEVARTDAATRTREAELEQWKETEQRQMPAGLQDAPASNITSVFQGPANSRGVIVAPFNGIIHSIGAVPGELVDTTRQLFSLADLSTVWVQADVVERDLGAVQVGETVSVSVETYPGRRFPGRVAYIPDQIDPRSGTARVRCEVPNPDGALRANMFAMADIKSPLGRDGIMVPDSALQEIDGKSVVFTRGAPGHFDRHVVRLGLRSGGFTEIVEGLAAKATVVTDGSFWLKAALTQSSIPDAG
ncbi:MAG: rane fusion protein heavy metal efflux system [Acetobacteraceae bacterium]|nr:rane fusion protein heavy metal efflux system [Acetobacteraceae bacterium]